MDLARHCILCDHQIVTIKDGTTCKLMVKRQRSIKVAQKLN